MEIAIYILIVILAVAVVFIAPYLVAKCDAEKLAKIMAYVKMGVQAAEQIIKGTGKGKEKKDYVISFLESLGYTDLPLINTLVESAVKEMNNEVNQ